MHQLQIPQDNDNHHEVNWSKAGNSRKPTLRFASWTIPLGNASLPLRMFLIQRADMDFQPRKSQSRVHSCHL